MNNKIQLDQAVKLLQQGQVIAYPTESVFGLGCDPFNQAAVEQLFHVKQRVLEKGLIMIAASVEQIAPYVDLIGAPWQAAVLATWPGPVTWILPAKPNVPVWVSGGRDTVAVRVSNHPVVQALCSAYGQPIISTSANPTTQSPAKSCAEVATYFNQQVLCLEGELGRLDKPTQIRDARTGQVLR